jgi:hypothetical protein
MTTTYHVYENWTIHRAIIHRSDCRHCNFGRGKHAVASTKNGRWHGPFASRDEARAVADATRQPPRECAFCLSGARTARTIALRPSSSRSGIEARVSSLIADFALYVEAFDELHPFTPRQRAAHQAALALRAQTSVTDLWANDPYTNAVYEVLAAWNMNQRGARLIPISVFRERLHATAPLLRTLQRERLEHLDDVEATTKSLWTLIRDLWVSETKSPLVATSKAIHHVLPDLLPPIDRNFTLRFFGQLTANGVKQEAAFRSIFPSLHHIAAATAPEFQVIGGKGMHTGIPKMVDNAIVGYVSLEMS